MRTFPNRAAVVTPSDAESNKFAQPSILRIGTSGDIAIRTVKGDNLTISNVQDGEVINLEVVMVKSTGTTATNIVRMWGE